MTLKRLLAKLQQQLSTPEVEERTRQNAVHVATAGLLLDLAHADHQMSKAEERRLLQHLRERFDLDEETARDLMQSAEEERGASIDHFAFTQVIRRNTSLSERIEIIRTMWHIVYADGLLKTDEVQMLRKLSELLGVEHKVMIDTKLDVRRELGLPDV